MKNFLIAILLIVNSCQPVKDTDNCHYRIGFTNNSHDIVFVDFGFETLSKYAPLKPSSGNEHTNIVYPKTYNDQALFNYGSGVPQCIEGKFNPKYNKTGKIYIYVFKAEIFDKYDSNHINENNLYERRYALTLEDLKELDFKIVYTGE